MASRSDRTARVCAMRLELSGPLLENLTGNANLFRESGPDIKSKRVVWMAAHGGAARPPCGRTTGAAGSTPTSSPAWPPPQGVSPPARAPVSLGILCAA